MNWVSLATEKTTNCPLYPVADTPLIWMGVSTANWGKLDDVVTVIVVFPVAPSPDLILLIPTEAPRDPTIRYSSITGWISTPDAG